MLRVALAAMALVASLALLDVTAAGAGPSSGLPEPVPSLEPAATEALWKQLVARRRLAPPLPEETPGCRPLRASFYAPTDWMRLATKLAANASPCADYAISIPPLAADKTQPRADQAWRIRALGPRFHALAEISWNGWSTWVSSTGSTWFAAGIEARRRIAVAGYDVSLGDTWALNELSSAVRGGNGVARDNARSFIRGLYQGDGSQPPVRGVVFTAGIGQGTTELSVYQARLQDWFEDSAFWSDMRAYVSDWSQEVYGDVRNFAVAGAPLAERRDALDEYLHHDRRLAVAGPARAGEARAFLETASSPLGNAAWQYETAFGWTFVSKDLMQAYVSAQTYALRHGGIGRGGFAWSPRNGSGLTSSEFTSQTGAILDRLAAAIRDSGAGDAEAACGPPGENRWCAGSVDGAWLNRGWRTFAAWKPSLLAFTTAPNRFDVGGVATMTIELRTHSGVPLAVTRPLAVTLASSSPAGRFSTSASGPWTSTLGVDIPTNSDDVSFWYRDDVVGSPVVTASSDGKQPAAQTQTVVATETETVADFDGDGDTDVGIYRDGVWHFRDLPPAFYGVSSDTIVPADYDGHPGTDAAIYRDGVWWIQGFAGPVTLGAANDVPVPGDYNGDGVDEPAIFRDGVYWIHDRTEPVFFGAEGDVPVPADYDGDGDIEPAIFRSGVWWILGRSEPVFFGTEGDVPVPGDYNGDAHVEPAIFRSGVWWIHGQPEPVFFGVAGDVPVTVTPAVRMLLLP